MDLYISHINLYEGALQGSLFIGLTFALQLWFVKNIHRAANRFFALALGVMILWIVGILGADIRRSTCLLPLSLAFGPLIYFYVRKAIRPATQLCWKDLLHCCSLFLAQIIWLLQITITFEPLIWISVVTYLYLSHQLIRRFYKDLKFTDGDRYRYEWRWLNRLLGSLGLVLSLWIPLAAIDYFGFRFALGRHAYDPLAMLMAAAIIRMAVVVFVVMFCLLTVSHILLFIIKPIGVRTPGKLIAKLVKHQFCWDAIIIYGILIRLIICP